MTLTLTRYSAAGASARAIARAARARLAVVAGQTLACLLIGALVGLALAGCGQ
jgi:hypothetical protein